MKYKTTAAFSMGPQIYMSTECTVSDPQTLVFEPASVDWSDGGINPPPPPPTGLDVSPSQRYPQQYISGTHFNVYLGRGKMSSQIFYRREQQNERGYPWNHRPKSDAQMKQRTPCKRLRGPFLLFNQIAFVSIGWNSVFIGSPFPLPPLPILSMYCCWEVW